SCRIEGSFTATEQFLNPAGDVQGGFLAAMLDDTLGPALVATLGEGQWAPTIDLQVQFLRPAQPGELRGHGRVVRRGRGVAFLGGELHPVGTGETGRRRSVSLRRRAPRAGAVNPAGGPPAGPGRRARRSGRRRRRARRRPIVTDRRSG